jgi:hypothetical protein
MAEEIPVGVPLALAAVMFVVLVLVFRIADRMRKAAFEARFPPISDEEFVARCTPGTSPDVALRVRRIIAKHLAVEYERVHPSMNFIEDIGAD